MTSKAPESTQEVTIPDASTIWRPSFPVSLRLTVATLGHGGFDPCHRWQRDGSLWRTGRLPSGSVSYRLQQLDRGEIGAAAWGAGAAELIASVPTLLGADDDPASFEPRHEVLRQAHRRAVGMRIPKTGRVLESLIPAVLEQKVIGLDAFAAWQRLVTRYGETAPGPVPRGMKLAPTAATWRRIPSWEWHRAGVEHKRASTAIRCATHAEKFERAAATLPCGEVYRLLTALPGVGRWTAAEVGHRVLGDADAVPLGDYHLPDVIGFGLIGESLPEDQVEEFLEPWRPHRYRVFRLLEMTPGASRPRRAPRMTRSDYRRI